MNHRRPLPVIAGAAVAVVVALVGCRSGTSSSGSAAAAHSSAAAPRSSPDATTAPALAASPGGGSAPVAGGAGSPSAARTTVDTGPKPGTGTAGAVTSPTTAVTGGTPASVAAGPAPAVPGTYRYRQVGSLPGTPAEGSLLVAPATASGTQVWTRLVGGSLPPATTVMLFNATGSYLVSPGNQVAGARATCAFTAPVPWPPWPTTPGHSFAGQASCTGPVTSYQVAGRVQATAIMSVDGRNVTTSVVVTTITVRGSYNGGAINMALTETDYYAPSLRVPVVTKTHVAGSALGLAVTTDRTDTLEATTPG